MMTTINLRGEMGRMFTKKLRLDVKSPAEAARAMEANFPGRFFKYLFEAQKRGVAFQVFVGKESIPEHELKTKTVGQTITFAPVLQGAKEGGLLNVIIGVVIIAAATIISQGTLTGAAISATFSGGGVAAFAANFGLAMALGGVATMIAGKPKAATPNERPENQPSYIFDGPKNRTRQGNVYPLVYGHMMVGSQRVSASVRNEDYVPGGGDGSGGDGEFDPNLGDGYGGYASS
jgi:predicted phage tail protein